MDDTLELPQDLWDRATFEASINRLVGLLDGIAGDGRIQPQEMALLHDWMQAHSARGNRHPYSDIVPVVHRALGDGRLSEQERLDILWLCEQITSEEYFDVMTAGVQRLQAQLSAVLADGVVSESELQGLQQWLADHGHLRGCWPYDELSSVVGHVLADGRIDAAEQRFLLQAFAVYAAQDADRAERDAASQGMPTLASLCTPVIDLQVAGKRCCLVGHSVHYPPALFAARVTALGGTPVSRVGPGTDVVVVGAESNPGWRYALFGRELDQALALLRAGEPLLIVHEEDFHRAAQALG